MVRKHGTRIPPFEGPIVAAYPRANTPPVKHVAGVSA